MSSLSPSKEPFDISLFALAKVVLVALAIFVFLKLYTLILLFFLGSMLSVVLTPACRRIEKIGLSPGYSIATVALGLLILFSLIGFFLIPAIGSQMATLIGSLPKIREGILERIPENLEFKPFLVNLFNSPSLPDHSVVVEHAMSVITGATEILTGFFLIWIFSVYLLADGKRALQWLSDFFPAPTRLKLAATASETSEVISAYAMGQFITSVGSALFSFLFLYALKVPGALTLATLAGLLDIIPIVGFFVALVPAVLVGFSISDGTGLLVLCLYVAYHLVESYVIVPAVYGTSMKVSGLVVILVLLASAATGGILLAMAILPIAASYPIIERIWLVKFLGRDVVDRHSRQDGDAELSEQVKLWDVDRINLQRTTTLTNRDLSKHFKRRILIVEDDADIRATLKDILDTEGYHTFIASNGNEALMTLESVPGIGLILMDINMPVMNGKEVFETLKLMPTLSKIPVVFLSASNADYDLQGAAGILHKPATLESVIQTVETHYARMTNGSLF